MTRTTFIVVSSRVIFGVIAAIAAVFLLLDAFIFDNPAASSNPLAWNLAIAPLVYLALYMYSLTSGANRLSSPGSDRRRVIRALLPALGILWYGAALLLLQVFCGGSFGCTSS